MAKTFRGTGAPGSSGTKAASQADLDQAVADASNSADNAAASASAANSSAGSASTSETNAATSETNAATSESNAATSESNAATSETNAGTSETNAASSASAASTSETNAATSEAKAEDWAEEDEDVEVESGQYSAKHWAAKAASEALLDETYQANYVKNSRMAIRQRSTSDVVTSSASAITLDQFLVTLAGSANITVDRGSTSGGPGKGSNYLRSSVTAANASLAATDFGFVQHQFEGSDIQELKLGRADAKTFTIGFWVHADRTGTYSIALRNRDANRAYVAEYTIDTTQTWEWKEITITGDVTGTWQTGTGEVGLELIWSLGCGTTYSTTPGTWQAGNYVASSNQVNAMASTDDVFNLSEPVLVLGTSVGNNVEFRSVHDELILCQRYFEKSYQMDTAVGTVENTGMGWFYMTGMSTAVHTGGYGINYSTNKASTPTIVTYSPATGTAGQAYDATATADTASIVSNAGEHGFRWWASGTSSSQLALTLHWTAESSLV